MTSQQSQRTTTSATQSASEPATPAAIRGIVSDIQRFSIHDGPGIRTTVFFKGCNMRCRWCHNPETYSPRPQLQIHTGKCIGCRVCLSACERHAHEETPEGRIFHRERCVACGACAKTCYAECLVLVGKDMTAAEVVAEVMRDEPFYRTSGGGVTLSGGEPLLQREFTCEILRLSREHGINTAIETNMSLPWTEIEPALELLDLVLMDIKAMSTAIHKEWTGISNERILDNARRLSQTAMPMIVRTPVIPGVNDTADEIAGIARFVADFPNLLYYELLAFHPLGSSKYASLGIPDPMAGVKTPDPAQMHDLAEAARAIGVRVKAPGEAAQ